MTTDPIWINKRALILLHERDLAAHGGLAGLRDEGLLDSALGRPMNLWAYQPDSDMAALAASYGFGLARNHPFVDGNKRAAFLSIGLFLAINKIEFRPDKIDAIHRIVALAAGEVTEDDLAAWIRANSAPRTSPK
jgi:death-on-curing protein